jgi:imidazolonepropionase-like amidohydrolase
MEADLLVVGRDPTKDLSALKAPRMIINDGTIVEP